MKKALVIIFAVMLVFALTACGDSGNGSGSSGSEIDPFDPEIFNVEEGGIVLNYKVDTSIYGGNCITEINIENQLPEDDIRSTFTYELEDDEYLSALVGTELTVCVDVPDEFWDDHTLTADTATVVVPPLPCALPAPSLLTDDVVNGFLSDIKANLDSLSYRKYYWSFDDEITVGSLSDVVDLTNITLDYIGPGFKIVAPAHGLKLNEDYPDGYSVDLGTIVPVYDENKNLVLKFAYRLCSETGEWYFYKNDDHMLPHHDDSSYFITAEPDAEGPWVEDISESDQYIKFNGVSYAEPQGYITYSYNCETGELTKISE